RLDVLHAEPRAAPIAPLGTDDRREPFVGLEARDAGERVLDHLPLEAHLRVVPEVLQRAAAAAPEDLARRHDAVGRRLDDAHEVGLGVAPPLTAWRDDGALAGERARHEHSPAADVGDAVTVVRQVDDPRLAPPAPNRSHGTRAKR